MYNNMQNKNNLFKKFFIEIFSGKRTRFPHRIAIPSAFCRVYLAPDQYFGEHRPQPLQGVQWLLASPAPSQSL